MRSGSHLKGVRANALWGSGERGGGGTRGNALWGSGKRRIALLTTLALVLIVPLGASAVPTKLSKAGGAFVAPSLLSGATAHAGDSFNVIVQGKGNQAAKAVADVLGLSKKTVKDLRSIDGVAVELTGAQILTLAADK